MSIAVKSGLPSLGSTEGAVISADEVSVSEDGSAAASVGEDLPRGKSAYEIAKENGFNGTETEWLASLKGEPGAAGASGKDGENGKTPYVGDNGNWYIGADDTGKPSRGAKGEKGEKGDTGAQGIQGEQGIQGVQGEKGEKGDTGAAGADGKTPYVGDNGNWYIGADDTGKPSRGAKGEPGQDGAPGADGKSAYQYAQDGGYTGTETEFAEKLAQEPLIGTTDELTPTQVYNAMSAGIPVKVHYFDSTYGYLSFTAFNVAESLNVIVSQTIVYYNSLYILAELFGNVQLGRWGFNATTLAQKTDIPSALPNPNALTFTGAVNATYDGSTAVSVEIPSGGSGGTDISLGLTSATVGQIIKVKAIDESGKPTAWEAADMAGGAEHWEKIADIDLRSDTNKYVLADFGVWRKAKVIMTRPKYISGLQKNVWVKVVKKGALNGYNCGYLDSSYGYVYWEFAAEVDDIFISSTKLVNNNPNTSTAIGSSYTLTPLDGAPSEYEFILLFTDTSIIQEGDRVTVIGVKR